MAEPLDPEKYHVLSKGAKNKIILLFAIFLLVLIPSFYAFYKYSVNRPSQTSDESTITINKGDSIFDISGKLNKEGVINSEFLFVFYTFINRLDDDLQAGIYRIPAGISIVDLVGEMQHGTNDVRVTFLEGWRVEEFAREADKRLSSVSYEKFVKLAKPYEGYLFPDTYFLTQDIEEEELLEKLKDTFVKKTENVLSQENLDKAGLTKEQVLIFASVVQREVYKKDDAPLVAGILIKRWQESMQLDADATTQYAVAYKDVCDIYSENVCVPTLEDIMGLNWWRSDLSQQDLDYESSYNTRNSVGLPVTPICNPGIDSIEAVINYQPSDYYFYLNDADGNTHFAKTLEGHNLNVSIYLSN